MILLVVVSERFCDIFCILMLLKKLQEIEVCLDDDYY